MADEGFKLKLAAIISADVEGYSRLMEDDEEATIQPINAYHQSISTEAFLDKSVKDLRRKENIQWLMKL
jgi:capsular polysaccharide biosynthesis protein